MTRHRVSCREKHEAQEGGRESDTRVLFIEQGSDEQIVGKKHMRKVALLPGSSAADGKSGGGARHCGVFRSGAADCWRLQPC